MADVLKMDEVAEKLRISKALAYQLVRDGDLRSIRVGRVIRVPADALDDFLGSDRGD